MKIIIANTNIQALLKTADNILGANKDDIPETIKGQATLSWLKQNFSQRYFSVCEVDNLARMNEITISQEKRDFMHTLHCVDYANMPQDTKDYLFAMLVDLFRGNISMSNVVNR